MSVSTAGASSPLAAAVSAQKFWNMKQPSPVIAAAVATPVPLPIRLSEMIPVEPVTKLITIVIVAPVKRIRLFAISQLTTAVDPLMRCELVDAFARMINVLSTILVWSVPTS